MELEILNETLTERLPAENYEEEYMNQSQMAATVAVNHFQCNLVAIRSLAATGFIKKE
jgi:hypothetical protein